MERQNDGEAGLDRAMTSTLGVVFLHTFAGLTTLLNSIAVNKGLPLTIKSIRSFMSLNKLSFLPIFVQRSGCSLLHAIIIREPRPLKAKAFLYGKYLRGCSWRGAGAASVHVADAPTLALEAAMLFADARSPDYWAHSAGMTTREGRVQRRKNPLAG